MSELHNAINAVVSRNESVGLIHSLDQSDAVLRDFIRSLTPEELGACGRKLETLRAELTGSDPGLDMLLNLGCCKFAELFHDLIREAKETPDAA